MTDGGNAIESSHSLILIADDDEDILELVRLRLARHGYATVVARDGAEALAAVRERKPDLALLDVAMPALDGYELTGILKGDPATRDIPVVLLTASAQTGDVAKGLAAGADDYITKPFSPQELLLRVASALKSAHRPRSETLHGAIRPASGQ